MCNEWKAETKAVWEAESSPTLQDEGRSHLLLQVFSVTVKGERSCLQSHQANWAVLYHFLTSHSTCASVGRQGSPVPALQSTTWGHLSHVSLCRSLEFALSRSGGESNSVKDIRRMDAGVENHAQYLSNNNFSATVNLHWSLWGQLWSSSKSNSPGLVSHKLTYWYYLVLENLV